MLYVDTVVNTGRRLIFCDKFEDFLLLAVWIVRAYYPSLASSGVNVQRLWPHNLSEAVCTTPEYRMHDLLGKCNNGFVFTSRGEKLPHNSNTHSSEHRSIKKGIMQSITLSTSATTDHQTFHGNSRMMLEKVIEGSPFLLRKKIRSKLMSQLGDGSITEEDVINSIKQTTPSMFLSKALETAKRYESK